MLVVQSVFLVDAIPFAKPVQAGDSRQKPMNMGVWGIVIRV